MATMATMLSAQRSEEDHDLLVRSTKKTKRDAGSGLAGAMPDLVLETPMEMIEGYTALVEAPRRQPPPISFRDLVAGASHPTSDEDDDDLFSDGEDAEEDEDPLCPVIRLTNREKEELRRPWRNALILKVWGKRVGYSYLYRRLNTLWRPKGSMDLVAIDNDYFLVRFGSNDDLEYAKFGGPWMILDHYLIVKEWTPDFDPVTDKTEKVLVWIRFPCLPIEYYRTSFLQKIRRKIGRPIRVDQATSQVSRGRFAHMCVEIDLSKPLISKFRLRRRTRYISYEGIHLVCFNCGMYGHSLETCPDGNKVAVVGDDPEQTDKAPGEKPPGTTAETANQRTSVAEEKAPFGSWMIVKKTDRRPGRRSGPTRGNSQVADHTAQSRSRFLPLVAPEAEIQGDAEKQTDMTGDSARQAEDLRVNAAPQQAKEKRMPAELRKNGEGQSGAKVRNQRRPNVVANEKQVTNQPGAKQPTTAAVESRQESRGALRVGARRAAEEDEHVVVRGEQGGAIIQTERIYSEQMISASPMQALEDVGEHHNDKPYHLDDDGDEMMADEVSFGIARAPAGGISTSSSNFCSSLTGLVTETGEAPWSLAVVYGSPTHHLRRRLWSELRAHKRGISGPWLLAGDFNAVTSEGETCNYSAYSSQRSSDFVEWIHSEGLIDMGYSEDRLTWMRGSENGLAKGARLDRALCSVDWRQRFSEASVRHLPRVSSDHAPILIQTEGKIVGGAGGGGGQFRFHAAWLTNESVDEAIRRSWNSSTDWQSNIQRAQDGLTSWSREAFGSVEGRKKILLARIGGIQRQQDFSYHNGLRQLEKKLRQELDEVLYQEELMWFQRSREEWIVSGDRNTRYYHTATMVRKARNKVLSLKDDNGNWITEDILLGRHVQDFYAHLFRAEGEGDMMAAIRGRFPRLEQRDWRIFNRSVTKEEFRKAVFDMSPWKAPGPDGLHAAFYQHAWDVVGDSKFELVRDAFTTGRIPEGVNDTLLVLIPKVTTPETVKQFRPISLCNVSYKVITKTITNRLKFILLKIIGPFQSSFVPGRQITDNILVYQEVMHSMRIKKGKSRIMAIKIDLEKAYDRLSWDFINDTLCDAGFNNDWTRIIMECVRSANMQILWNGTRMESFKPGRGIRQGDARSPALFVLCMERLSQSISQEVSRGTWKGIQLFASGPTLSHLCFADDMVLFTEASMEQVAVIRRCFDHFCEASGQRLSLGKSQVFFSKNTPSELKEAISLELRIPSTTDLGRYLGVPSLHGRVTSATFSGLLDRVRGRLDGWRSKTLSLAGRITLAKAALLPKEVCLKIEAMVRFFIWGGVGDARKPSLVSWDVVTKCKQEGGLGIRRMQDVNTAFLAKLGWRMRTEQDRLWIRVLMAKYPAMNSRELRDLKRPSSNAWKGICATSSFVEQGLKRVVRNGQETQFWMDNWIHGGRLYEHMKRPISLPELYSTVADYWEYGRGWKWERFDDILDDNWKAKIHAFSVLEDADARDEWGWGLEIHYQLSV
ncbi:PREDICTED: uncharacterized protein LOC109184127 [Ipomoea nil]|uniref:uncharacterized protein LOC109184127 n=1 Tax=Ipomoea nil TaxID=35883 RepID=UPI000901F781|nr:PREDICTED: uncharacterized protein LOC109184127 [Ipomoea nil]